MKTRKLYMQFMSDGAGDLGPTGGGPAVPPAPVVPPVVPVHTGMTDEQWNNRIAAVARKAADDFAKTQGHPDAASLAAYLANQKALEDSVKTDQQRREDALKERERGLKEREKAAEQLARSSRIQRALTTAGFSSTETDEVKRTAANADLEGMVAQGLDATADDAAVAARVAELKGRFPSLFVVGGSVKVPGTDPGRPPARGAKGDTSGPTPLASAHLRRFGYIKQD